MKRKLLSLILASAMVISAASAALAADKNPSVYVDDSLITFVDQPAVIKDDRTLVPARGVFEAMDSKVEWDGEARKVTIRSYNNITQIVLTIDNPTMEVYTFTSVLHADKTEVALDVAPQILNDRTMIPLRAISEALKADVQWDQEKYRVDITTENKPASKDGLPALSLSASNTAFAAGDTVELYINLSGFSADDSYVSGASATIAYDRENFEFVKSELTNNAVTIEGAIGASNDDFSGMLKTAYIILDQKDAIKENGVIMKVTFKSLTGKDGEFSLSNGYDSKLGFNTVLLTTDTASQKQTDVDGNNLFVDTTPVTVSASAATEPAATAAPETTAEPAATAAPEATAVPAA